MFIYWRHLTGFCVLYQPVLFRVYGAVYVILKQRFNGYLKMKIEYRHNFSPSTHNQHHHYLFFDRSPSLSAHTTVLLLVSINPSLYHVVPDLVVSLYVSFLFLFMIAESILNWIRMHLSRRSNVLIHVFVTFESTGTIIYR